MVEFFRFFSAWLYENRLANFQQGFSAQQNLKILLVRVSNSRNPQ
jgi:hypothetical protein